MSKPISSGVLIKRPKRRDKQFTKSVDATSDGTDTRVNGSAYGRGVQIKRHNKRNAITKVGRNSIRRIP